MKAIGKLKEVEELKEIYELWVDYLKESKPYETFCKNNPKLKLLNPREISSLGLSKYLHGKNFFETMDDIYSVFGDIHAPGYSFDEWWVNIMFESLVIYKKEPKFPLLFDEVIDIFIEDLNEHFSNFMDEYKEGKVTKKQLEPFIRNILTIFLGKRKDKILLLVDTNYSKKELMMNFIEIIDKHKEQYSISSYYEKMSYLKIAPVPFAQRIRKDELRCYLEAYKGREQKINKRRTPWKDVIKTQKSIYTGEDSDPDGNDTRVFQMYYWKAKTIIKNVEKGIFPGNYQPSKKT